MMDGVEILNQTQILEWVWKIHGGWVIFGAVIIFLGAVVLGVWTSNYISEFLSTLLIIIILVLGGFVLAYTCGHNVDTGKYEYQVMISDEVKINEFNEKYTIIKQEGKIYTIKFND